VPGEVPFRQGRDHGRITGLLDLAGVEEAGEGVGQFQGRSGVEAAFEQIFIFGHQPGQFEALAQGADGGGQVEGQVTRLERRLALVQVAQGADLRQQHRALARRLQKRLGQGAGGAAGGQQDGGFREAFHAAGREGPPHARGQISQKRPVRGDGEPAWAGRR